ncbi:MAG: hypothetical protein IPO32_11300 [Crocinitomicaceae bacterium]|jgi:hypothetical protein|nr:hypothetical protein [Crocinitomicaceae bacterium]MBK6950914.1 hypothetical protein [Crocinitomicaceae bacterium]MBK9592058.1 hypothetical protein [Crocinitomicaceae bacterium]
MKRILLFVPIFIVLLQGCNGNSVDSAQNIDILEKDDLDSGLVKCPYGHSDSIIPIIYGYPSEEDFQNSDSGLVALGGCSLPDRPATWFCKIHQISF